MTHLRRVFEVLRDQRIYTNLKKYDFFTNKVIFLDYVVLSQDIEVDGEQLYYYIFRI